MIDANEADIVRDTFIFLRTRVVVDFSGKVLDLLAEHFPYDEASVHVQQVERVPVLGFGEERVSWSNGIVLRTRKSQAPIDIAARLEPALREFDAWAIHDCAGGFVERPAGGLMARFIDQLWDGEYRELQRIKKAGPIPVGQVFVMGREDDNRFETTIVELRAAAKADCHTVFNFSDGAVLFYNSNDPAKIMARRCERFLKRMEHWAIVDSDGVSVAANGEDESVWADTVLSELRFEGADMRP